MRRFGGSSMDTPQPQRVASLLRSLSVMGRSWRGVSSASATAAADALVTLVDKPTMVTTPRSKRALVPLPSSQPITRSQRSEGSMATDVNVDTTMMTMEATPRRAPRSEVTTNARPRSRRNGSNSTAVATNVDTAMMRIHRQSTSKPESGSRGRSTPPPGPCTVVSLSVGSRS
jgi:hypothetical protein